MEAQAANILLNMNDKTSAATEKETVAFRCQTICFSLHMYWQRDYYI